MEKTNNCQINGILKVVINPYVIYKILIFDQERKNFMNRTSEQPRSEKIECPKTVQLVSFDEECDEIEDLSSHQHKSQTHKQSQSIVSDETEKRKKQVREKINEYLNNRKSQGMVPKNNKFIDFDNEEPQRVLMDELGSIEHVEKFNSEIQQFILAFNKNPDQAIQAYIKKGIIKSDDPNEIAGYLIRVEGLDKGLLGDYFGQNNEKILKIFHAYCKHFKFKKVEFDKAIRQLLYKFRLPGEAQQIERIIWEFSLAYYETNQEDYDNADELFPLAYAIIMLATDAHNPKQEKKMSRQQFIKNTQGPCPSISPEYLSDIYDRITKEKFETEISYIETLYARLKDLSVSNIGDALAYTKDLIKGDVFLKVCKNTNKFVQRKIMLSEDQSRILWICDPPKSENEEPRFILIHDIVDLTLGLGSPVMQKNKVPQHFDSLCFTIGTTYRTLDLKAKTNKERAKWVNYIKAILLQRRDSRKDDVEKSHEINLSRQKIQQIWNTDIFPHWDRHWDYKNKKPKEKGYIARGIDALCCCFRSKSKTSEGMDEPGSATGFKIRKSLLDSLWKLGLPENSRKTLWPLVIGNNLALTQTMLQDVRKRAKKSELNKFYAFNHEIRAMAEIVREFRPDIPPIRDLLMMSQVFSKVIPKTKNSNPLSSLINIIHMHHFLAFYRGQKAQIELRIHLFQFLLQKLMPKVWHHFTGLKLETRMYLVSWFLSVFSNCFHKNEEFLFQIWDNFLLEGEIYLFKVGLTIVKYYEVELKMCTFHEGLNILRFPKQTSPALFFDILENQIEVKEQYYHEYIEKRKHAIIKTKVQSIPLE